MEVVKWLLVLCIFFSNLAAAQPIKLVYAYEDKEIHPFFVGAGTEVPENPGIYVELLRQVTAKLGWELELVRTPWPEVLSGVATGKFDAFTGSFKPERAAFAEYPKTSFGELDTSKYVTRGAYVLYVPTGSDLRWQPGQGFVSQISSTPVIGVPRGYSISDQLQRQGVSVFENRDDFGALAEMVLLGRVEGIVVPEISMQFYLMDKSDLQQKIVETAPPVRSNNYYVILSRQFVERHPNGAELFWRTLVEMRDDNLSDLYQKYGRSEN